MGYSILSLRKVDISLSNINTVVKGLKYLPFKRLLCCSDISDGTPNFLLKEYDIYVTPSFFFPKVNDKLI